MKFIPTPIAGAFVIEPEPAQDARGFFARTWCEREFAARGLEASAPNQSSVSYNLERGTLRGMHYQAAPHEETKLVRCTRGAIHDVILDLRPDSTSRGVWFGVRLDERSRAALFVPRGVAHGFLTLDPDTEVIYQITGVYQPDAQRGVRWDDPAFAIAWPEPVRVISERDRSYPDFAACRELVGRRRA